MADMVELKRKDSNCCVMDSEHPVGFFLEPHMVKALGLDSAEPGQSYKLVGEIAVKSVTRREDSTDLYVCLTKAAIGGKADTDEDAPAPSAKDKLASAYGVKDAGKQE